MVGLGDGRLQRLLPEMGKIVERPGFKGKEFTSGLGKF